MLHLFNAKNFVHQSLLRDLSPYQKSAVWFVSPRSIPVCSRDTEHCLVFPRVLAKKHSLLLFCSSTAATCCLECVSVCDRRRCELSETRLISKEGSSSGVAGVLHCDAASRSHWKTRVQPRHPSPLLFPTHP